MSAGTRCRGECVRMSTGRVSQTAAAYCLSNPARASSSRVWKVVVAEDEHAFARAAGEVELQSAVFSPGVGMGDIAQADDRVAGPNPAAPLGEEAPGSCA